MNAFLVTIQPDDGRHNNIANPDWGAANTTRIRQYPPIHGYMDDLNTPPLDLPSARRIMEEIFRVATPNQDKHQSHLLLEFGLFLVFDLSQSLRDPSPQESLPIPCDGQLTDFMFCPAMTKVCRSGCELGDYAFNIPFQRFASVHQAGSPRASVNTATSFLDLSQIYGVDDKMAAAIRGEDGAGGISLDENGLPPRDKIASGLWKGMLTSPGNFCLHVVFMRYHNLKAAEHAALDPSLDDNTLFHLARMDTIAVYQNIVEEKYFPSVTGDSLGPYTGYDPTINPAIDVFFSTVAFRYAHTSLSSVIRVVDKNFQGAAKDPFLLRDTFKQDVPSVIDRGGGIEPFLRGLVIAPAKAVDASFVDDMNLWAGATSVKDIQRSRDEGIPPYNAVREVFGLSRVETFEELVGDDAAVVSALKELYNGDIDKVDSYIGALLEKPQDAGFQLGPLFVDSIRDQYNRLRAGDRFWYKSRYQPSEYEAFPTLSDVIKAVCNESEMALFPQDSFVASDASSIAIGMGEREYDEDSSRTPIFSLIG